MVVFSYADRRAKDVFTGKRRRGRPAHAFNLKPEKRALHKKRLDDRHNKLRKEKDREKNFAVSKKMITQLAAQALKQLERVKNIVKKELDRAKTRKIQNRRFDDLKKYSGKI